jgi:hypothetical protein
MSARSGLFAARCADRADKPARHPLFRRSPGPWRAHEAAFENTALPLTNLEPSSFESVPEFCAMIDTPLEGWDHGQGGRCHQRIGYLPASCRRRDAHAYVLVMRRVCGVGRRCRKSRPRDDDLDAPRQERSERHEGQTLEGIFHGGSPFSAPRYPSTRKRP